MVFDPIYPDIYISYFMECGWRKFYGDVKESEPQNYPELRGKGVNTQTFVYPHHVGYKLKQSSRTGFIIFLNMTLVVWYSNNQITINTSVFGA